MRLTADHEEPGSPFVELTVEEWRRGGDGIERDLRAFPAPTSAWAAEPVPEHAETLTAVLTETLEPPDAYS